MCAFCVPIFYHKKGSFEMWSEKTANGKVKFVERYKDPLTDKMERVSVTMEKNTASTRKQATALLNERIEELINAPQSGLTL